MAAGAFDVEKNGVFFLAVADGTAYGVEGTVIRGVLTFGFLCKTFYRTLGLCYTFLKNDCISPAFGLWRFAGQQKAKEKIMATMREIAEACHVSISTVSNILNGRPNASEETAKRVLYEAKKRNYIPNYMAKNLKRKSTKTIGIIVEDLVVFNCVSIVDGIHEFLEREGYHSILSNLRFKRAEESDFSFGKQERERVREEIYRMEAQQADGIIYIAAHVRELDFLPSFDELPLVVVYSLCSHSGFPSVVYDDAGASYMAVRALIARGHTKIGLLAGKLDSLHTQERWKGYRQALLEAGLPYDETLVHPGMWKREEGGRACRILRDREVTAIFAMNDVMAAGVYDQMLSEELSVGTDLDLIGFDNREISEFLNPELSTVKLPLNQMGREAARLVLRMIQKRTRCSKVIRIPCELIFRGSVSL